MLILLKNKFYQVVKWIILVFVIVFISAMAILIGKDSGMILYFIPGILFPTIIFDLGKWVYFSKLEITVSECGSG